MMENKMNNTIVKLRVNDGIFKGLAKQNLLCHQGFYELIDNAIAASIGAFHVDILIQKKNESVITLHVADKSSGMDLDTLKKAIQLGESATTNHRLNEHGFGLKNALATFTQGENAFEFWTKSSTNKVYSVEGPFKEEMVIKEQPQMLTIPYLGNDFNTVIKVDVPLEFIQTVQGRGAKAKDLNTLRLWLIEHLGVTYRGYLDINQELGVPYGNIFVSVDDDRKRVPAINIPLANAYTERFDIELDGKVYNLTYKYGSLDNESTKTLIMGEKTKYYYLNNQTTQGIDIRLGKRTIATSQLGNIWYKKDGAGQNTPISRHNSYNDFTGELLIPELPRGVLTTINNKSNFNLDDEDWKKIFEKLNEFNPIQNAGEYSEAKLIEKFVAKIKDVNPEDVVSTETKVWFSGTRIDIYRKTKFGEIKIYEMKAGTGAPQDLYQLKMYWDGLLVAGIQPDEGYLLVKSYDDNLIQMVNILNNEAIAIPANGTTDSKKYNFIIKTHDEVGLS